MFHSYEQELGEIQGLPTQNNFPSIFPNHVSYYLLRERIRLYIHFQTLGFENFNSCFSTVF